MAGAIMPITIDSNAVRLDHLVFQGTRLTDPALSARRCASDKKRPMAGGLLVNGNSVTITRSVFRDMACYTALEYGTGVEAVISDNTFIGNGTHNTLLHWADGLTIHTAQRFQISSNRFRDNTDVQLIFGSCVGCTITNNNFNHSGTAEGGAFAEIMLQAWPNATSGDFTGTQVTRNTIDCGAQRRCGFGIMIGSAPWYEAPTFGGAVTDNRVRGAMLALNVDYLTGPMVIAHNDLEAVSGTYPSMCGPQRISGASANFSARSRMVLPLTATDTATTAKHYCILNYSIR
ncbi:right-handed parallel beta-helix repeat-containing protein [Sphingomonas sp. BAUL-RG-20F-R05-02]|uniref:right-handed parallel beta-helix repeat-containing protein n=1 Tax=Sphingomonas sp. BAUL-RG-20F-R05-02 TaxID=2914830 RepID=UPI001F564D7B|nr:right-handed parallel beta-helix repeat-containing protein [Sphingomonas sp. BAUL-RG-20F-R05-02]